MEAYDAGAAVVTQRHLGSQALVCPSPRVKASLGLPYDALSPAILRAGVAPHRVARETA
jgi:hypothetical protein